jgi:hypothetical protein
MHQELITALNKSLGDRRSQRDRMIVTTIMTMKQMQSRIEHLQEERAILLKRNAMLHDAASLALKALDGGFAEKVDYAQFDKIRSNVVTQLEAA